MTALHQTLSGTFMSFFNKGAWTGHSTPVVLSQVPTEEEDHSPGIIGCTLGDAAQYEVGLTHCNNNSFLLHDLT